MQKTHRHLLSALFFAYGIYSVFSMQRDFQHTQHLTVVLLALVPVFFALNLIGKMSTRQESRGRTSPHLKAANWFSQWLTQNLTQYILMFCLPFFYISQRWIYAGLTTILLLTTLWESSWKRLLPSTLYRQVLRMWSLLCAGSFLLPCLWPKQLHNFYPALTVLSVFALLPSRLDRNHIKASSLLITAITVNLLLLPYAWRFPMLSVWLDHPHFATNEDQRHLGTAEIKNVLGINELKSMLGEGSSLCCIAPVVAPPGIRERITQEWTLDGQIIERPELKSYIQGNAQQKGFHSYFCKRNLPSLSSKQILRCRLSLQDRIFLGEIEVYLP
ncbi:MAG: hypothetical protein NTX25_17785 [Proteobacteria bacterium]|nr:hypothetical protein [Pseudomonadota bacterium]